jgi:hypothetical protein
MTASLAPVVPIVAKLIRLMGSDKDGEILAAVHALRRVLAGAGLTLHDLAGAVALEPDQISDDGEAWRAMARALLAAPRSTLSERERSFVTTMAHWRGKPSRKQGEWLEAIYARVRKAAA